MKKQRKQRAIKPPKTPPPPRTTREMAGNATDDFKNFTIAVSYEWDGNPPRMTWYDRLHRKGIRVRGGDANEFPGPLARRQSLDVERKNNGVVFQEGFILCRNQDVANEIAYEAGQFGAVNVWVGRVFMDSFTASVHDAPILEEYFMKTSKRGRKPVEEKGRYTITCLEELITYEADLDSHPIVCPTCQAFRFYAHIGNMKVYQPPKWKEVDLWDYWLRSRFGQSDAFEIPLLVKATKDVMPLIAPETSVVKMQEPTIDIPANIKLTPELQLRIWDAAYSLSTKTEEDRIKGRLGILGAYWNSGGQNTDYLMSTPDDGFDLIDLCILMRDELAKYL